MLCLRRERGGGGPVWSTRSGGSNWIVVTQKYLVSYSAECQNIWLTFVALNHAHANKTLRLRCKELFLQRTIIVSRKPPVRRLSGCTKVWCQDMISSSCIFTCLLWSDVKWTPEYFRGVSNPIQPEVSHSFLPNICAGLWNIGEECFELKWDSACTSWLGIQAVDSSWDGSGSSPAGHYLGSPSIHCLSQLLCGCAEELF